ncbi:hypothetical protein LX97_01245 [Nonlabens dokdonensis]|uniref:Uncharacterized protein n=3 Tax=Nonlabens dokdonensis TaxID=328515 RepID=L7W4P0_NONDD|nr:hypothetical protein DDD_1458 [Nonlabens dokdonensis DSW-6]PZX44235.1 hypothetical protein LX97_01245 [Nonlabens dokdonensis]
MQESGNKTIFMKKNKMILFMSIFNMLFFIWVYITHVFEMKWTIAGVMHEMLMLPMTLLAPVLVLFSGIQIYKNGRSTYNVIALSISAIITLGIIALFLKELM